MQVTPQVCSEREEPVSMMMHSSPAGPAGPASLASLGELRHRRVRLPAAAPAAAAVAAVRAAVAEWRVPVDSGLAGVLASDLVISAVTSGAGEATLMLSIRCTGSRLRVDVHDLSFAGDSWQEAGPGAETNRGLLLAALTAAESGHCRTPAGRAVFYALAFAPVAATGGGHAPRGAGSGDGEL
jgi:hypothetical protein